MNRACKGSERWSEESLMAKCKGSEIGLYGEWRESEKGRTRQ